METNNVILSNYSTALADMVNSFSMTVHNLTADESTNKAMIKTLGIMLEAIRSQTVIIQSTIDNY